MMQENQKRIEEIRERLAKSTPGRWTIGKTGGCVVSDQKNDDLIDGGKDEEGRAYYGGYLIGESMGTNNACFLAHAKTDIEFLLTLLGGG